MPVDAEPVDDEPVDESDEPVDAGPIDEGVVRERRIVDVLMALRDGEVTTYGDIAADAGYPRQARLVGRILQTTEHDVPWWRVVNAAGRLVPGHETEQAELLREEDVVVRAGRVVSAPHGRFGE